MDLGTQASSLLALNRVLGAKKDGLKPGIANLVPGARQCFEAAGIANSVPTQDEQAGSLRTQAGAQDGSLTMKSGDDRLRPYETRLSA